MKLLKLSLVAAFATALFSATSAATVALQIRVAGFSNSAGTPTNGMYWGILVDADRDGFDFLSSPGQHIDALTNILTNGNLSIGGTATDDFYYFNSNPTAANQKTIGQPPTGANSGYIFDTGALTIGINGVNTGDQFGVIWWQTDGSAGASFGFYTNPGLVIPGDGSTTSYSSIVATASASEKTASFTTVPEPAPAGAIALGLFALISVRRFRLRPATDAAF